MTWCNDNGIKIYFKPINDYSGRIIVEKNGVGKMGEKIYKYHKAKMNVNDPDWSDVIRTLYTYYFLKLGGVSKRNVEIELEICIVKLNKN